MDEAVRQQFEDWISSFPYERGLAKWDNSPERSWPGQYVDIHTQLAWEAWQKAGSVESPQRSERVLFVSDSFCPCCGHNRDRSSVSSIDLGNEHKECQMCRASWGEVDPLAQRSDGIKET